MPQICIVFVEQLLYLKSKRDLLDEMRAPMASTRSYRDFSRGHLDLACNGWDNMCQLPLRPPLTDSKLCV